ncbi:filamentous hemagglutinin N-terminal domain-containing protein [Waterburya agarophytonicola K14]|uniref:Filamentous hemagglutinin N-terminal domain-containing protein n=1 Tax=Waterburya agarophytonicola KI4 TaxID=2874699 RepID=A0A964BQD6_9CYAN|nr:filamentous hemagglutinin N-terminal domain-containing protein [Waterburya agarophytonicola]MCC0177678.1 filamentous hemagglutinin N-terminal domain-containing protein [Waterburya agarophytonicola KI4]
MPKVFSPLLRIGICVLGFFGARADITLAEVRLAQITPDGTANTQVNQSGNIAEIEGGITRGTNLFHSFQDFSVPTDNTAFFNNVSDISNIFSRVTGGNTSNIDGLIKANDSANLFLINPAGIIFGESARLDIGGSFLASTARGIIFENGEFSAVDLENPPLLAINAPIGLDLRNNSAEIVNRSQYKEVAESPDFDPDAPVSDIDFPEFDFSPPVGLKVNEGESIRFNAGNILFDGGLATAPGGSINLEATGNIEIRGDAIADFTFRMPSLNTSSTLGDGGAIELNSLAGNIKIINSNLVSSSLVEEKNGGSIVINARESTILTDSFINSTSNSAIDRGGNVTINADSSIRLEDTRIDAGNFGDGRSGDITIATLDRGKIELVGTQVAEIDIFDDSDLNASLAEAAIFVDAFGGEGLTDRQTGGTLSIQGGAIEIDNYNLISRVNKFSEFPPELADIGLISNLNTQGNAGDIFISGNSIAINNSSLVTGTLGNGNAGNIDLNAIDGVVLSNGTELSTRTVSFGSAGVVNIKANSLTINNSSIEASNVSSESATGELEVFAGNINLNLGENLILRADSTISAIANGDANGGNIRIEAASIIAFPAQNTGSDIIASATGGLGGAINITSESIFGIAEGSEMDSSNDIDASSGVDGLDGTVSITTSNVDALQGAVDLTNNPLDSNDVTSRTCTVDDAQGSTLTVKNIIGTPLNINQPFISENIYINGQNSFDRATLKQNSTSEDLYQEIIPARGVVVQEDGQIVLVAYPTPDTVSPSVYGYINCQNSMNQG